jgi:hypothetical protein
MSRRRRWRRCAARAPRGGRPSRAWGANLRCVVPCARYARRKHHASRSRGRGARRRPARCGQPRAAARGRAERGGDRSRGRCGPVAPRVPRRLRRRPRGLAPRRVVVGGAARVRERRHAQPPHRRGRLEPARRPRLPDRRHHVHQPRPQARSHHDPPHAPSPPRCPRHRRPASDEPIKNDRRPRRDPRRQGAARSRRACAGRPTVRSGRHPRHADASAATQRRPPARRPRRAPAARRGQRPQPPRAPVLRAHPQGGAAAARRQPRDRRARARLRLARAAARRRDRRLPLPLDQTGPAPRSRTRRSHSRPPRSPTSCCGTSTRVRFARGRANR